jgi:ABC-type lipoprotein release transport system permease subunit
VAVFFLAGLGALAVALVTVGVKAYRAAMLDPTTALRDE